MKYALIGCGRIAVNHMKAALNNKLEIVAVCDVLPEKMEAILEKYDLQNDAYIKRYTDYKEMIAEEKPELVSIATESGIHAEIALHCIENDVNVIIEKPMAMSISDADQIIELSEKMGIKVSACHQNRFNVAVQELRKAIEAGRFGKLSHGSIHVRWNRDHGYYDQASWRGTWEQDGGALMNQCIHGIDLLRWMMGDEIDEIYGATRQQFHDYLVNLSRNKKLIRFHESLLLQCRRVRMISYLERKYQDKAYRDHQMILEGLKSGDSRLAQQALAEHIETARLDYLRVMKEKNITEDFGMLRFFR